MHHPKWWIEVNPRATAYTGSRQSLKDDWFNDPWWVLRDRLVVTMLDSFQGNFTEQMLYHAMDEWND